MKIIKSILNFLDSCFLLLDESCNQLLFMLEYHTYDGVQDRDFYYLPYEDKKKVYKAFYKAIENKKTEFEVELSDGKIHKIFTKH